MAPAVSVRASSPALWLARLRWAAVVGHAVTIAVAAFALDIALHLTRLAGCVALETAVNVAVLAQVRRGRWTGRRAMFATLVFDVVLLTLLLHGAGGASNPFSFLYLVHLVLCGVVLGLRPALALTVISASLFGALYLPTFSGGHEAHDPEMMRWHIPGMWVAFVVAAGLIVFFVGRILSELERNRAQIRALEEAQRRHEVLASLGTLAAGTAHELATPLSTIAVVSKELEGQLPPGSPDALVEDMALLRAQVELCQRILRGMAAGAGRAAGEGFGRIAGSRLVGIAIADTPAPERFVVEATAEDPVLVLPVDGARRALKAVLANALDASPAGAPVRVLRRVEDGMVVVEVVDRGPGIPAEDRPRVVEPFFTTKAPGAGMGLGLFLADSVLRELGGWLRVEDAPGGPGTRVSLGFPPGEERT